MYFCIFKCLGSSEEHYARNLAVQSMRLGFRYFFGLIDVIIFINYYIIQETACDFDLCVTCMQIMIRKG